MGLIQASSSPTLEAGPERMSAKGRNGVWGTLPIQVQLSKIAAESVPGQSKSKCILPGKAKYLSHLWRVKSQQRSQQMFV